MVLRTAFLLLVAIMLLPADERQQAILMGRETTAPHQTGSFCERNPYTCGAAHEIAAAFMVKARFAMTLASSVAQDVMRHGEGTQLTGSTQEAPFASPYTAPPAGTLMPGDRAPSWRVPGRGNGA